MFVQFIINAYFFQSFCGSVKQIGNTCRFWVGSAIITFHINIAPFCKINKLIFVCCNFVCMNLNLCVKDIIYTILSLGNKSLGFWTLSKVEVNANIIYTFWPACMLLWVWKCDVRCVQRYEKEKICWQWKGLVDDLVKMGKRYRIRWIMQFDYYFEREIAICQHL